MDALIAAGKIRRWGVSNLDSGDMDELVRAGGGGCATDQILYNVTERRAEFELMPKLAALRMPVMAYSPVGQGRLPLSPALATIAKRHEVTAFQVALSWVLRDPNVIAIPKAADEAHVRDNLRAAELTLDAEDLAAINADFPPPTRRTRLAMLKESGFGGLAQRCVPIGVRGIARHVAIEVRRPIRPPHRSALAQVPLDLVYLRVGVSRRTRGSNTPACAHQLLHEGLAFRLGEVRIGHPPQPAANNKVAAIFCRGLLGHPSAHIVGRQDGQDRRRRRLAERRPPQPL